MAEGLSQVVQIRRESVATRARGWPPGPGQSTRGEPPHLGMVRGPAQRGLRTLGRETTIRNIHDAEILSAHHAGRHTLAWKQPAHAVVISLSIPAWSP